MKITLFAIFIVSMVLFFRLPALDSSKGPDVTINDKSPFSARKGACYATDASFNRPKGLMEFASTHCVAVDANCNLVDLGHSCPGSAR